MMLQDEGGQTFDATGGLVVLYAFGSMLVPNHEGGR
jgi:hypothetical protein